MLVVLRCESRSSSLLLVLLVAIITLASCYASSSSTTTTLPSVKRTTKTPVTTQLTEENKTSVGSKKRGGHDAPNAEEEDDNKLLHEELNLLLTELRQVADAIESVRKEHSRLSKGVGEISSAVKDMNTRSEHIRKKVRKMSKTINKNTHHHKLKDTLKSLQKDHEHILKAVTAMSTHHRGNHDMVSPRRPNHNSTTHNKSESRSTNTPPTETNSTNQPSINSPSFPADNSVVATSPVVETNNSIPNIVVDAKEEKNLPKKVVPMPKDCTEVMRMGNYTSGVYGIQPEGHPSVIKVWCDHTTQGGGWTVIVARLPQDNHQDFNLKWEDYKNGFGDPAKEHWIGNEPMHAMTKEKRHELRVNITEWNDTTVYAEWKDFRVAGEDKGYALTVGRYSSSSTAGDALKWHDNMKFSTPDRDNDALMGGHCARKNSGGWWYRGYRGCYQAHPTGQYQNNPRPIPSSTTNSSRRNFDLGPVLAWQNWRGDSYFPKTLFLMFRPVFL